jgi:hypothetical protein
MEHHCPHAPFDTPAFVPGRSRKPKLKHKSVDTDKVVTDRVKLIARIIFGKDGPEDKQHARMREAFRPMRIKGRLRDQQDEDSCVRQPVSESGPGGRGLAKYLQYGVVGYLTPKKAGSILEVSKTTPKVWVCACTKGCLQCYDVTASADSQSVRKSMSGMSTIMNHLTQHGVGQSQSGNTRGKHVASKQKRCKQLDMALQTGMTEQRFFMIRLVRLVIHKFLSFQISEDEHFRALAHPSWEPVKRPDCEYWR